MLLAIRRGQLRLLAEHQLMAGVGPDAAAVQVGLASVELVPLDTPTAPSAATGLGGSGGGTVLNVPAGIKPQGLAVGPQHVVVWSSSRAAVMHIKDKVTVSEFGHAAEVMYVMGDQSLVQVTLSHVLVGNMAGKTAMAVQCSPMAEDEVVASSAMGEMVAVVTKSGCVSVVQGGGAGGAGQCLVSMKEMGPLVKKAKKEIGQGIGGELIGCSQIAVNATGSHVALTGTVGSVDILLVYARETGSVAMIPIQPVRLMFDARDPRLLVVETRSTTSSTPGSSSSQDLTPSNTDDDEESGTLHAFFVEGPDVFASTAQPHRGRLLAVRSPYLFLLPPDSSSATGPADTAATGLIARHLLADFADLTLSMPSTTATSLASSSSSAAPLVTPTVLLDRKLVQGMLDFRLALARNNLDLAFQLMPVRSSKSIWLTLASMCVKSRQVKAVMQCLAHAGHAMGVRLVREALGDGESGGQVEALGVAAQVLGMDQEADKVYVEAGRWELVSRMAARTAGDAKRAIDVAKAKDKLGVPRAHYDAAMAVAKLDPENDQVVQLLELSDARDTGIPRHLLLTSSAAAASAYLTRPTAPAAHLRYRAQWAESQGDLAGALALYARAGDTHAVVRVHCELGAIRDARECAEANVASCPAAAYHLAQYYERAGKVKDAVAWYAKARCIARAVGLAKEHGLVDDVMSLALRAASNAGGKEIVVDAARWFEGLAAAQRTQPESAGATSPTGRKQSPTARSPSRATTATRRASSKSPVPHGPTHMERAVRLYLKAGMASKALDLAVDEHLFDLVLDVVNTSTAGSTGAAGDNNLDAAALTRIAEFMLLHHQHQKAVDLYVAAGNVDAALHVCLEHHVALTEAWVDQVFAPLASTSPQIWSKVADACMSQNLFDLASKKYTLAGDKVGAIKALIKQGNVEQVVFFASVSGAKNKDMYILAANFLQTRDWRSDPALLKHIVTFYTKAKAYDHLGSFFETCAQIEVDEYSSYEKALGALKEAHKCTAKSTHASKPAKLMLLERKMDLISKFVAAQQAATSASTSAAAGGGGGVDDTLQLCAALLNDPDVEIAVRTGDIYALLIETYLTHALVPQAREIYTRMLGAVPLRLVPYYLDAGALAVVDPEFKERLAAAGGAGEGKAGRGRPGTAAASEVDDESHGLVEEEAGVSEISGAGRGLGV
ncbi:hypothetical protein BCR44DRAFT_1422249 [Catenaria anguillulae PL171]|uniref:Intraflagellar transport protein 140 n=1 Tax=Catenaria anguillulae PL171 TaxID=765915 RepID=A0A1Y2I6N9_9FUNG|nr:hypothetical protein BCR44DRAFT_1422249 [Catenaria anguillulae PL171]